ncbi:hypothetical protein N5P37_006024 [Trichoderma harzianum]|nr:hypothetical protein N5P37_006024 [Trichoderma harzianum]
MKVEEAEGTVMPLESIPPAADLAPMETLPVNPKWDQQDALCTKLFGPWDNLPCHNHLNEGRLLRDLDDAIVLFETLIYHSDAGFHAWREHHKQAMEAGLAEIPTYPYLQRRTRDGKRTWNDDVWEQRYFYLVYHRQQIIMERLSRLPALPRYAREDFFGSYPAPHRAMLNKRGKGRYTRPLKLRCDWWRSVDFLLERASLRWGMDAAALKATFWADEYTSSVKKQAPEWEGTMREEDQAGAGTRKEKIESLEDAVGLAANLVSGALCFARG